MHIFNLHGNINPSLSGSGDAKDKCGCGALWSEFLIGVCKDLPVTQVSDHSKKSSVLNQVYKKISISYYLKYINKLLKEDYPHVSEILWVF